MSPRDVGQSCACSSPPRQRSAAADITACRVPPIPIARWSFVPRIAAEIDAVTVPSWISLMRAPAARMSSTRSRSEEHTSELQSRQYLVCRLLLEKKKQASPRPAGEPQRLALSRYLECLSLG